jgi:hypothetical protein
LITHFLRKYGSDIEGMIIRGRCGYLPFVAGDYGLGYRQAYAVSACLGVM